MEKSITQTKVKLYNYYGDSTPSISMVKSDLLNSGGGGTSTKDAERSGRPLEVSTPEAIERIHDMVLTDRQLKVRQIVEAISISHDSVVSIFNDHLGKRKLSARWVPRYRKKQPHWTNKKVRFHQDNARVQTGAVSMAKIHEHEYLPDLVPCDSL